MTLNIEKITINYQHHGCPSHHICTDGILIFICSTGTLFFGHYGHSHHLHILRLALMSTHSIDTLC